MMLIILKILNVYNCQKVIFEDLRITETLTTPFIKTPFLKINNQLSSKALTVPTLNINSLQTNVLHTDRISSKENININGQLTIESSARANSIRMKQDYSMQHMDFFEDEDCHSHMNEFSKTYKLKPHTTVRIQGNISVYDNWDNQTIFLYANKKMVWSKQIKAIPKGVNVKGQQTPDPLIGQQVFQFRPINIILNHNSTSLQLAFSTDLEKHPCDASFYVDNVMIYAK